MGKRLTHRADPRALAAKILHRVAFAHQSLDRALAGARPTDDDRALTRELAVGSVRYFFSLSGEVNSKLTTALKSRDGIVFCLLVVGAYQLRHMRIPAYAAVNETVNACARVGRPWARGLTNQVLRRIASTSVSEADDEAAKFDHPLWLIEHIRRDYPNRWEAILAASLTRAPQSLRVNLNILSRDAYRSELAKHGQVAHPGTSPEALVLDSPIPAANLPGAADGWVSIQDGGAIKAAALLDAQTGERVLDACAAPGGKAAHILERTPEISLVALDVSEERCEHMRHECRRLRIDAGIVVRGDATQRNWWDGKPFDRILLDAPCSGTGTLRRHPDIKLLKRESDLGAYHALQERLLDNLWSLLKPGGRLLYCTCSLLTVENDAVVARFLARTPDATVHPIAADWGIAMQHGRQSLPEVGGDDGFYYARLEKRPIGPHGTSQ